MTIHLDPKLEALIQNDVERGAYQSADEFVTHAVQMLHEQEHCGSAMNSAASKADGVIAAYTGRDSRS